MLFIFKGAYMILIKDFFYDESGVSAIEYGLIAVVISLAIITAVRGLGTQLRTTFTNITTQLTTAGTPTP
jgi:pilus assembly protein Flp/PilA